MVQQGKTKTEVRTLIVDEEHAKQRIDNFLFNQLKNIPKSRIYRMLRGGEVRVNKKRVTPTYKLQPYDSIRIPPFWTEEVDESNNRGPGSKLINLLLDSIVFEDNRVLVVNKPTGIASHGGSGINFGVIEILRAAREDLKNLELVHRLDRETSGCLMLAKKRSALRKLHELIREGKIYKKYVLLVKGCWQGGARTVDVPLLKNQLQSGERMVRVDPEGKKSVTIFRPLKIGKNVSLIEAELKTGRTHQIRVHAAHIGYPILGDKKYGDNEYNSKVNGVVVSRLFLHAEKISFYWDSDEKADFVVKPDGEFEDFLMPAAKRQYKTKGYEKNGN